MQKIKLEQMLPVIEEAINSGESFRLPITGTSMNPLLVAGRDFALISKAEFPLKAGDVPLYRRDDGAFVLHRVMQVKKNNEYVMCGDNQFVVEHGIRDCNIIGIATGFIINGKEINASTDEAYLKHTKKYLNNIKRRHPIAQLKYKIIGGIENGKI